MTNGRPVMTIEASFSLFRWYKPNAIRLGPFWAFWFGPLWLRFGRYQQEFRHNRPVISLEQASTMPCPFGDDSDL